MQEQTGQIYEVDEETAKKHGLIPIPNGELAEVQQMNRHARRAWAAEQRRKEKSK